MLHANRLAYLDSPHAPPQLWEWPPPSIHHLVVNTRTFGCQVVQRYFRDMGGTGTGEWAACGPLLPPAVPG